MIVTLRNKINQFVTHYNKEKLGRKPEKNVFRCDDQSL